MIQIQQRVEVSNPMSCYHGKRGIVTSKGIQVKGCEATYYVELDGGGEQQFFASDLSPET